MHRAGACCPFWSSESRAALTDVQMVYFMFCRFLDEISAGIAVTTARPQSAFNRHLTAGVAEFPLYCEGVERTRFAYGIYLLNKVVPQFLCARYPFASTAALGLL